MNGFYSPTFELLEISSRPVLGFYGEAMEKIRSLVSQKTKQRTTGQLGAENKKLNYATFVHLDNYLKFASLERFPVYIWILVNLHNQHFDTKICEGSSKFHSHLKL